ncbi:TPA: ATP-binding protein [Burkholderia aenigmatica]|uniref:ATP-binding protein n=1 Tax=Burkholderia sp. AU45251 TaxID=3059204 RepID=UPI00264E4B89|nr:ATP-binding protein [Burkholderia sp. AU45251]HDR9485048.1 ATP-binding protein [Burkholderia aenigmatica]MDN7517602.1 ATP-binding protein [Burkholderia sp. AU45251]HDR9516595.1 ATP-binding protein [Burkholderia aenigmatica]HDR9593655.1 ATP-binding protein [Burkholderia aenigmatica]HDR9600255.1 ATP-binding protein [Burkholderia aenigmatica]
MKIKKFSFSDPYESGWNLSPVEFNDRMNLLVGATGSGKTRLLNMLMNIGSAVVQGNRSLTGKWAMEFETEGHLFLWKYDGHAKKNGEPIHMFESLSEIDKNDGVSTIFERNSDGFFFEGARLPKLGAKNLGINLLKEEDAIKPAYSGFRLLMRRSFSGRELDDASAISAYPYALANKLSEQRRKSLGDVHFSALSLNGKLYILKKFFPRIFESIVARYRSVFPDVININIGAAGRHLGVAIDAPLVLIQERNVQSPTQIGDISSGMLKVLLMLADIATLPRGSVYLVDEYENSLGVNAIDFFPEVIIDSDHIQFMLTSHHPFLINRIPVDDWLVFSRKGSDIRVTFGDVLSERYGSSKQQRFVQLLNDPLYTGKGD